MDADPIQSQGDRGTLFVVHDLTGGTDAGRTNGIGHAALPVRRRWTRAEKA